MKRIVVIGGGITGLAAAHRILERCVETSQPIEVRVLEAVSQVGGIIKTDERDGFLIERGPDSFITEKPDALSLVRRLGLEPHLIHTNNAHRRSFVVRKNRLLPVPDGFNLLAPARLWPFVTSGIFSWPGKARIAMDLVIPRRQEKKIHHDESLAEFVRRRLGREALERMAQPMAGGIYTGDPETLSLQATLPRFQDMERQHRSLILGLRNRSDGKSGNQQVNQGAETVRDGATSGARYNLFRSFDQGMQLLTDQLAAAIMYLSSKLNGNRGLPIRLDTRVDSLARHTVGGVTQWVIRTGRDETFVADAVCLALPAYVTSRFLRRLDPDLASDLAAIPYASSATINLAYKREDIPHQLNGFGFVVPFIEKRTVMACTFSSVKFSNRAPAGHVLLRAFVGGALQPELVELNDPELVARVRQDLRLLLGAQSSPVFAEVSKWDRSMPQYFVGHVDRVRSIANRVGLLPGLAIAGNAFHGPGIPDCIRSGESAADKLFESLQQG